MEKSDSVSTRCTNPDCQYILDQYNGMEKKLEHELWRAGNAIGRARALRFCASLILYATAIYDIVFSGNMWSRLGAVAIIFLCSRAMHAEG